MRTTFKIGLAISLLALSACSPPMLDEVVMVEEPIATVEPAAPLESKSTCGSAGIDDGIGGTGCPAPIE